MISRTRPLSALLLVLALALAACGGGDGGDAGDSGDGAASGEVAVTGTDELKFEPSELRAAAGEVSVELTCESGIEHNFLIEESGDELIAECAAGETGSGTVELEAGDYTFYCNIPGHREAGMEGTLTVEG